MKGLSTQTSLLALAKVPLVLSLAQIKLKIESKNVIYKVLLGTTLHGYKLNSPVAKAK